MTTRRQTGALLLLFFTMATVCGCLLTILVFGPGLTRRLAELTSLALTIPTLVTGAAVVWIWGPAAWKSYRAATMTPHGWFVLGVVTGFVGAVLDNLYWSIPWSASYFGHESTNSLMANGVYFNIVSRQGLGTFAGYCHLKAAEGHDSVQKGFANRVLAYSHMVSVYAAAAMVVAA